MIFPESTFFKRPSYIFTEDYLNHDIRCILLQNAYYVNYRNRTYEDIKSYEIKRLGYQVGGQSLINKYISEENGIRSFHASKCVWYGSIEACSIILYDSNLDNSLICQCTFNQKHLSVNGNFIVQWHESGILIFPVNIFKEEILKANELESII
jgi:hypothetical protein